MANILSTLHPEKQPLCAFKVESNLKQVMLMIRLETLLNHELHARRDVCWRTAISRRTFSWKLQIVKLERDVSRLHVVQ